MTRWPFFKTWSSSLDNFIHPYWQILENSTRFFPKFQYPGAPNQTDFWKTNPTVFEISIYRVWAGHIFWKFLKVLFWMSFPESGLCNALNSKIDDWMSFPVIRSCSFTGNLPMVECRLGHFEEIRNSRKRTQTGFRYSCPQNSDFNLFFKLISI